MVGSLAWTGDVTYALVDRVGVVVQGCVAITDGDPLFANVGGLAWDPSSDPALESAATLK